MSENCLRCGTGKKFTIKAWNECPVQEAEWKAETYYCLLPRFLTRWWFLRKKLNHLTQEHNG